MSVRAKFYVASVEITQREEREDGGVDHTGTVKLLPVTRGEENKSWSRWTPSGQLLMSTLNPKAFAWFQDRVGRELYLDFTDAEAGSPPA